MIVGTANSTQDLKKHSLQMVTTTGKANLLCYFVVMSRENQLINSVCSLIIEAVLTVMIHYMYKETGYFLGEH